jgi:predicted lysophospholipase L1 biosynthesis ABC-type transport system permease subunit
LSTYVDPKKLPEFKKDLLEKTGDYISFIEVEEVLEEIKSISNKALRMIQVLFAYIFFFCITALVVSIIFLIPFKQKKSRLYHILGASRDFIQKNNISEYLYLQTIAMCISVALPSYAAYFVLSQSDFI